jgi:hypothetical protein
MCVCVWVCVCVLAAPGVSQCTARPVCGCVSVCACVRARVRARVRACVHACMRVCGAGKTVCVCVLCVCCVWYALFVPYEEEDTCMVIPVRATFCATWDSQVMVRLAPMKMSPTEASVCLARYVEHSPKSCNRRFVVIF